MTLEELRALSDSRLEFAVARTMGWTNVGNIATQDGSWMAGTRPGSDDLENIPDYATDLNAITAAVREWCGEDYMRQLQFSMELKHVINPERPHIAFPYITATARDLSMALVLAAQGEGLE